MKVCYLGKFRLPNGDAAAARVLNVARALREAGHDVSFISWGGVQRDEDCCDDGLWRVDGFSYMVTNELPQSNLSAIERLCGKIRRGKLTKRLLCDWAEPIDVIISYNNSLCRWLLPFCKRRGIKLISDITEWYDCNELKPTDWLGYAYDMHIIQHKVKNKIVISSYLDNYYSTTHNIVVPATCDVSENKWVQCESRVSREEGNYEGITLIYAGNPARKDAIHYAINAVHRLIKEGSRVRLLLLGINRENYLKNFSDLLTTIHLSEQIQFLGKVTQDNVPSYYAQADFMILLREQTRKSNAGFPTKFSESFTSGTPVIANMTSDLGLYLKDGETGFVVTAPNETAVYTALKEKILRLNREEINTMKQNVRIVAKQLDYHAFVEPLRKFMDELK